ncbi:MAG: transcriptional regulator [Candidatus Phlomobacter fragariae]
MTGLDKAIKQFGSQRKLAIALGVAPASLNRWVKKNAGKAPPKRLLPIYELTGIKPHEIRPDLYPNPTDGIPVDKQNTI